MTQNATPELFKTLVLETRSDCTRNCKTCLRATYPHASSRLSQRRSLTQLSMPMIRKVINEAAGMGFDGGLCLNFFNEPLIDTRLAEIALYAKQYGHFSEVYANTNGDLFEKVDIDSLDGIIDRFNVALYQPPPQRETQISAMFRETRLTFTGGGHVVTHYSPFANLDAAIEECCDLPCRREARHRMIISSTGEMRMCCEDIAGEWSLGYIHDHTLEELWFGGKHVEILDTLSKPNGRHHFPYCKICPRP